MVMVLIFAISYSYLNIKPLAIFDDPPVPVLYQPPWTPCPTDVTLPHDRVFPKCLQLMAYLHISTLWGFLDFPPALGILTGGCVMHGVN